VILKRLDERGAIAGRDEVGELCHFLFRACGPLVAITQRFTTGGGGAGDELGLGDGVDFAEVAAREHSRVWLYAAVAVLAEHAIDSVVRHAASMLV
jgi:hypothetical protein